MTTRAELMQLFSQIKGVKRFRLKEKYNPPSVHAIIQGGSPGIIACILRDFVPAGVGTIGRIKITIIEHNSIPLCKASVKWRLKAENPAVIRFSRPRWYQLLWWMIQERIGK